MVKCVICGKEIKESYYRDEIPILCGSECFHVNFWNEKAEKYGNGTNEYAKTVAIVDGSHYTFHPDVDVDFRGFGGRQFKIVFHDGRVVQSKNVWHQGTIPQTHKHLLPDNAIFVESDEAIENRRKHVELIYKIRKTSTQS